MTDAPGRPSESAPIAPAGTPAGATVCTACSLVCEDGVFHPRDRRVERLCDRGADAIRRRFAAAPRIAALVDGRPADVAAAIDAAAGRLAGARRVLVTGLDDLTIEGVAKACDVAEALGALIGPADERASTPGGSTIARHGEITAAWEELRDRADLVVFWAHDPTASHPRFVERFVAPALPDPRRTIAVGLAPLCAPPCPDHLHLPLDADDEDVDLARVLLAATVDRPRGVVPPHLDAAAASLRAAIDTARCVAFVTGRPDPDGLSRGAVTELVRALSRRLPAFEIPLEAPTPDADAAGAAMVLTWRYGLPTGAALSAAAGTTPARSMPLHSAPLELVEAGSCDAVLALGRLPPRLDEAIHRRIDGGRVVRIAPDATGGADDGIRIRRRELGEEAGTLLRADGRTIVLNGAAAGAPPTAESLLAAILGRILNRGGREGGMA